MPGPTRALADDLSRCPFLSDGEDRVYGALAAFEQKLRSHAGKRP